MYSSKTISLILMMTISISISQSKLETHSKEQVDIYNNNGENPLPVGLSEFDSFVQNDNLILYWTTATEVNSFMFEVERKNIETSQWEKRGHVIASGVSNSEKNYSFFEEDPTIGSSFYRLKMIDIDGSLDFSKSIQVNFDPKVTGLVDELAYKYNLYQNYPNPFNPSTTITYSIPKRSKIRISIYSIDSSLIAELHNGIAEVGEHSFDWDASSYASGVYLLKMISLSLDGSSRFSDTKKMVLVK